MNFFMFCFSGDCMIVLSFLKNYIPCSRTVINYFIVEVVLFYCKAMDEVNMPKLHIVHIYYIYI